MMIVMVVMLVMGGPESSMGMMGAKDMTQSSQPYERDTAKPN
ncbi:MAG: hypothetical protein Q8K18_11345 [Burkholderiales bacterium]|nr:hypothetical protein [Burkholderiales bacterium]